MHPSQWFALTEMGLAVIGIVFVAGAMVWLYRFFNRMVPVSPEKRETLWRRFLRSIGIEFVR